MIWYFKKFYPFFEIPFLLLKKYSGTESILSFFYTKQ